MIANNVFYVVFLSQILLISYYYPKEVLSRINRMVDTFPPSRYPKLYPDSIEMVQKGQRDYQILNHVILAIGFALMFAYGFLSAEYEVDQEHAEGLPIFFGAVQFLPFVLMEISGAKQFKLMRAANVRSTRVAQLHPRRLFDFVSPIIFVLAVVMFIAYILIELYTPQFRFQLDKDTILKVSVMTVTNLLFGLIIIWSLSGKKLDPHQAHDDRMRQIGFTLRAIVFVSLAASIFSIVTIVMGVNNWGRFEIIINSIYFQLIAVLAIGYPLRALRLEEIDFSEYREDDLESHVS